MSDAKTTTEKPPPRPTEFPIHPLCRLLPRPNKDDRDALKLNIKKIGVQEPIMLAKVGRSHAILDGWTRQEIVLELYDEGKYKAENGEPIQCSTFYVDDKMTPEELLASVEAKSLRRNLNGAQKACRALLFHKERVKLASMSGHPIKVEGDLATYLAKNYGTNRRYFVHVNQLAKESQPLFDAVYSGAMTLAQAAKAHQNAKGKPKGKPAVAGTGYADATGSTVPKHLDVVFQDVQHFEVIATEIAAITKKIKTLCDSPSGAFLNYGAVSSALTNVARTVSKSRPHVVCKHCKGKGCDKCKNTGFLTELMDSVGRQRASEKAKKENGKE